MTSRRPARSHANKGGVVGQADIELSPGGTLSWHLGMTFEAEVGIPLDQQLGIDRTMWFVTNSAAFAHRAVLENHRTTLLWVTTGARFIHPGHGQSASRFQDITAMGIMALHAIHFALRDRVMLREAELRLGGAMALKTCRRIFAWIEDEFATASAARHMQAPRPVARLATGLTQSICVLQMNPRMRAGGEQPHNVGMAFPAALVAYERGSGNGWRRGQY